MTAEAILILLVGITIFDFVFDKVLGMLNNKSRRQPIPENLSDIYNEESYQKSQKYQSEVYQFSIIGSTFSFLITLGVLLFGGFGWLDNLVRAWAPFEYLSTLYFFGILYIANDIISIPFQVYGTFVIEEKYGFNKTSVKTFLLDKVKGWLLAGILGGILLSAFIALVAIFESTFWIYFWGVMSAFMIFMNVFYTSLFVPLFNKLKPLENGDLKDAITQYASSVNFPLNNVFVIDGSKRSSKGNAFFSGLGQQKKVVLYDTLIEKHTEEEIVGVLAHEVGHYKKRHVIWSMVLGILQGGLMLWLLSLMLFSSELSYALGGKMTSIQLNILAFGMLYSPLSTIIGIFMNVFSRKNEYEADEYAVRTYKRQPLIDALKKLTSDTLGNLTPHPWFVFVNYSHPSLSQRISAMEKIK